MPSSFGTFLHDDDKHRTTAKKNYPNGVAGLDGAQVLILDSFPYALFVKSVDSYAESDEYQELVQAGGSVSYSAGVPKSVTVDAGPILNGYAGFLSTKQVNRGERMIEYTCKIEDWADAVGGNTHIYVGFTESNRFDISSQYAYYTKNGTGWFMRVKGRDNETSANVFIETGKTIQVNDCLGVRIVKDPYLNGERIEFTLNGQRIWETTAGPLTELLYTGIGVRNISEVSNGCTLTAGGESRVSLGC